MFFTDSNYWIALFCDREENHSRANELSANLSAQRLALSEHALGEVFTVICRRYNANAALEATEALLDTQNLVVEQAEPEDWRQAALLGAKYGVSFTDALIVILMRNSGSTEIVSFDADFDRMQNLQRIF